MKIKDLKKEYNIIDIRSKSKYLKSHIYNAVNIDENLLINLPHLYLDKSKTYYIYCSNGIHSKRCSMLLNSQGYNVINIEDGFENKV